MPALPTTFMPKASSKNFAALSGSGTDSAMWRSLAAMKSSCAARGVPARRPIDSKHLPARRKRQAPPDPLQISGNGLSFPQALEQRRAQQKLARQLPVIRRPPQLIVIALPHRRIPFGQESLVADGLRLRMRDGHVAALPLVAVEHRIVHFLTLDGDQFISEIDGVVNAAVHTHGADRAVHVGGIAHQDSAANTEFISDALMHDIKIAGDDFERLAGRQEALQPRL